jgi:hypothetical protein
MANLSHSYGEALYNESNHNSKRTVLERKFSATQIVENKSKSIKNVHDNTSYLIAATLAHHVARMYTNIRDGQLCLMCKMNFRTSVTKLLTAVYTEVLKCSLS